MELVLNPAWTFKGILTLCAGSGGRLVRRRPGLALSAVSPVGLRGLLLAVWPVRCVVVLVRVALGSG